MYCEPRPMTQFKILTYALHRCRSHFFASDPHVKLGGTNLQKKKLIRSALHLTMFAAQRFQPVSLSLHDAQHFLILTPYWLTVTSISVLVFIFLLIRVISDFATPHSDLGQRIRGLYQNVKDHMSLSLFPLIDDAKLSTKNIGTEFRIQYFLACLTCLMHSPVFV